MRWTDKKTLVVLWMVLRVYTLLCSVLAARLAGKSVTEIWTRWDTIYYVSIVTNGYSASDVSTNFHPLFPWLAKIVWFLGVPAVPALLTVSSLATLALLLTFHRLALIDQDASSARTSSLLFMFWPISYVLFLPYTESLWLLFAVLCFLYARRGDCWAAAFAGALATLTRQQGLFLIAPILWELWASSDHDFRRAISRWTDWLSVALIPLAYLFWIVYRTTILRNTGPDFSNFDAFISSTLLSPVSRQVVKGLRFTWPWEAMYLAIERALSLSYVSPWMDLMFGLLFLLFILLAWRGMRGSYRIYVAIIALVSFSFHTGMEPTGGAYIALPRHLLLAFPVFIGLGTRWKNLTSWPVIMLGFVGITFFIFGYFWVRLAL